MQETVLTIEELEERLAPSAMSFAVPEPSMASTTVPVGFGNEPAYWHPLWPVDPWPPGQWPVS